MAFKYPDHPLSDHKNPFEDADGKNPFSEKSPAAQSSDAEAPDAEVTDADRESHGDRPLSQDDPYVATGGPSYKPTDFVTAADSRSGTVFWFGVFGFCCALVGSVGLLVGLAVMQQLGTMMFAVCALCTLVGLMTAWPAWMMGRADLAAMNAGALESQGRYKTRWGHRLGLMGMLILLGPVVYLVYEIFRSLGEDF